MRIVALIILIFGFALAAGATLFANKEYARIEAALAQKAAEMKPVELPPQIETTPVIVATQALRTGQPLTEDLVKIVEFPKEAVPASSFSTMEDLFGTANEKRIVLRSVEPSEPILKTKVTGFGERATISAQLTPGMRAFTIRINAVSGVAGFLLPNDRVDIFMTRGARDDVTSNVIMQNVKVIAVDQRSDKDSNLARVARTATVEVTAEDAQKLTLAQSLGKLTLSLRQIDEVDTMADTSPVKIDDIIPREEVIEPKPEPVVVQQRLCVRKGTELICQ